MEKLGTVEKISKVVENREKITMESLHFYIERKNDMNLNSLNNYILKLASLIWKPNFINVEQLINPESAFVLKKMVPAVIELKIKNEEKVEKFEGGEDDECKREEERKEEDESGLKRTKRRAKPKREIELLVEGFMVSQKQSKVSAKFKQPVLVHRLLNVEMELQIKLNPYCEELMLSSLRR